MARFTDVVLLTTSRVHLKIGWLHVGIRTEFPSEQSLFWSHVSRPK